MKKNLITTGTVELEKEDIVEAINLWLAKNHNLMATKLIFKQANDKGDFKAALSGVCVDAEVKGINDQVANAMLGFKTNSKARKKRFSLQKELMEVFNKYPRGSKLEVKIIYDHLSIEGKNRIAAVSLLKNRLESLAERGYCENLGQGQFRRYKEGECPTNINPF